MATIYLCGDFSSPDETGDSMPIKRVKDRLKSMKCAVLSIKENKFIQHNWSDKLDQIVELLKNSQEIYVLPHWKENVISRIELTIAMDMRLHTLFHPVSNKEIRKLITTLDG